MSLLIPAGVDGYYSQTGFFSTAQTQPVTIISFKKVSTWNGAGYFDQHFARLSSPDGTHYFDSAIRGNAGTREMATYVAAGGSAALANYLLGTDFEDQWRVQASVCASAADHRIVTVDSTDTVQSDIDTASRSPAGVTRLELFVDTFSPGDTRTAFLAIYQSALTNSEVQQFAATGAVTGKTPYAIYEMTTDWASTGGQVLDSSGNGRHITPPASWVYSSDNPNLGIAGITSKTLQRNGVDVAAATTRLYVFAGHSVDMTSSTADFGNASLALTAGAFSDIDLSATGVAVGGNITVVALPASGGPGIVIETTAEDVS